MTPIRTVALPGGETVPCLGIGTWMFAERRQRRADEIAALQLAVDLGMTVVDTAEMYADGRSEELVAEALSTRRKDIFLVSKVMPHHATVRGTVAACHASLRRLKTDHLDLYLLHWRGNVPLTETLEAFQQLKRDGKIRHWGVSNFDLDDLQELPKGAATNQVLYNLSRRGIEHDLLPWCRDHGVPVTAYSPLEQGRLLRNRTLAAVAGRLHPTPAQVALAWVLRDPQVIASPKSGHADRVRENHGALQIELSSGDLDELDRAFPPPKRKTPLEML